MYFHKAPKVGVMVNGTNVGSSFGALGLNGAQASVTDNDGIATIDLGGTLIDTTPIARTGATQTTGYDGGSGTVCGWVHVADDINGGTDVYIDGRVVAPSSGTYNLVAIVSGPVDNALAQTWELTGSYKINGGASVDGTPIDHTPGLADVTAVVTLNTSISVSKYDVIHVVLFIDASDCSFKQNTVIHGLFLERTAIV